MINQTLDHRLRVTVTDADLVVSSAKLQQAFIIEWGQNGSLGTCPFPLTAESSAQKVASATQEFSLAASSSTEARGVVGILKLFTRDFLVLVVKTQLAATLPSDPAQKRQHNIWHIQQVLAIPLEPVAARETIHKHNDGSNNSECSGSETESEDDELDTLTPPVTPLPASTGSKKRSPFYWRPGRIGRREVGSALLKPKAPQLSRTPKKPKSKPKSTMVLSEQEQRSREILDKRIIAEFSKYMRKGMYLAYDGDASHPLSEKSNTDQHAPWWQQADKRFWWNAWLSSPLVEAKLDTFIYPVFQGFVEQTEPIDLPLTLDKERTVPNYRPTSTSIQDPATNAAGPVCSVSLCIISRRSIERPGFRYQRRGVNARGGVSNAVETEFLVQATLPSLTTTPQRHIISFTQFRGSIPLFWSQSPWALKPPAILERTEKENNDPDALQKHFDGLKSFYGPQLVINLAEQAGKEGVLVKAYRESVQALQDPEVQYVDFDFHRECRGMAYENISRLLERIEEPLAQQNFFWADSTGSVFSRQTGACRVNCMDCLDRTNVVQSAIARSVLSSVFVRLGLHAELAKHLNRDLNGLWASNGDAISLEYAGTSALKGDFTRTGKRDFRGIFNDATNSLARLFQNTVLDFFKQAMLDYVLGVNVNAFAEFQDKLVTPDPGHLYRLAAIRQAAIETCTKQLILPSEAVVGGWTLLSPTSSQDLKKLPQEGFEEKVLLLTDQALCVVSYEYSLEKIREYVRIPLDFIQEIRHGSLILSTLSSFARDPIENYGFILKYRLLQPGTTDRVEKRKNTYSLDTVKGQDELTEAFKEAAQDDLLHRGQLEQEIVFKHMRKDLGNYSVEEQSGHDGYTGEECIKSIVDTIVATAKRSSRGVATEIATKNQVLRSLEDAGASETFVARILHSVEKYIWL